MFDLVFLKLTFEQCHFDLDHDELLVQILHLELVVVEYIFSFPKTFAEIRLVQLLLSEHDAGQDGPLDLFVCHGLGTHLLGTVLNDD